MEDRESMKRQATLVWQLIEFIKENLHMRHILDGSERKWVSFMMPRKGRMERGMDTCSIQGKMPYSTCLPGAGQ